MELFFTTLPKSFMVYLNQSRQIHLNIVVKKKSEFPVLNPADDCVVGTVADMQPKDAKKAIKTAYDAFKIWKEVTPKERSIILRKWYDICEKNKECLAQIITAESGKPLIESRAEITYGNSFLHWYADCARHIYGEIVPSPWKNKYILLTRQPLGVVSIITPWNFPFAMITRKVGALMAAGCTCVIKPSEDTPLTALAAADLAEQAGVPKGVINIVTTCNKNAPAVGTAMCLDDRVQCISFTGSTDVGKILYGHAAKNIKRVFLELGGNAPFIVLPSADIQNALDQAMVAKFRNTGQTCIAANRFLVHEKVYDKFVQGFKSLIEKKCILGPGIKEGVTCGPMINDMQAKKVSSLVECAIKQGARVLLGGDFDRSLGKRFYKATILTDIKPDMNICNEEVFGPVVVVLKIKSEGEALKIANNTKCGLASYVFTKDLGQAFRMSKGLEYGMVGVNDSGISVAESAFGGVKESGIGREGSLHGALEFTDIKYTLMSGLDK